jgi:hypothetical protein
VPDVIFDDRAYAELVADAGVLAVTIVARRIVADAKDRTLVLSTRPPGRRQWGFSLPPGRLRESIDWALVPGNNGGATEIGVTKAGLPLARFRNLGGRGRAAYAATGRPRGDNPSIAEALALQVGAPIP